MTAHLNRITATVRRAWPHAETAQAERLAAAEQLLIAIELERVADDPMILSKSQDLALFAHTAVQALQIGSATDVDINNLAMISNVAMLLAECGYGAEALDQIEAAQNAVRSVRARHARTGRVGCTGPELVAIREMVDIHDQQLHLGPTQRQMTAVIAEMRRRMAAGEVMS